MSDLPTQGLLQQMNARSISGEHLEVLGKRAAAVFTEGRAKDLNEAVVSTVKTAGLSPEHVRRVVEFANTAAYLTEFNKEGSVHRVVDFGLADPAVVLQDLNDGGGGSSYDTGSLDYNHPPPETKTASAWDETAFGQMFASSGFEYPEENPLGEVIALRDKLAGAYETTTSMLSSLEVAYDDVANEMFNSVKQAALAGHSLGEIAGIWQNFAESDEYVKTAFAAIMDRLVDNGVFRNHEELADSFSKTASVGVVNPEHPVVTHFQDYCEVVAKLAEARGAQEELGEGTARLTAFLKDAAANPGLLERGADMLTRAAGHAETGGQALGRALFGSANEVAANRLGTAARVGTKYVLPAVAINEAYRHTLKHNPTAQSVREAVVSAVPGTDAYRRKELELAMRAQGYGDGQ